MSPPDFNKKLLQLTEQIATQGFFIWDDFLPETVIGSLAQKIKNLSSMHQLQKAGTGRAQVTINAELRGDYIYWLNEAEAESAEKIYFDAMEALRQQLNQQLYLGLFSLESHLALYPAGSGYKKHLDRFSEPISHKPQRQVSCILYLNPHWQASEGGALRLYLTDKNQDILPLGGRLLVFLSDRFYHEVLPSTRERLSLTGWFLSR